MARANWASWSDAAKIASVITAVAVLVGAIAQLRGAFSSAEPSPLTATATAGPSSSTVAQSAKPVAAPAAGTIAEPSAATSVTTTKASAASLSGRAEDENLVIAWAFRASDPNGGESFAFPPGTQAARGWPTDSDGSDPIAFARGHGGIPAGHATVKLDIRGKAATPVIIHRVEPVIVEARSVPDVAYTAKLSYGCGGMPERGVIMNLDKTPPRVRYTTGEESDGFKKLRSMTLKVSPLDPETMNATALTKSDYILWALDVVYEVDGVTGKLRVDRDGQPFEVTGVPARSKVMFYSPSSSTLMAGDGDPYVGYC